MNLLLPGKLNNDIYLRLLHSVRESVILIDPGLKILFVNKSAQELWELNSDELAAVNPYKLLECKSYTDWLNLLSRKTVPNSGSNSDLINIDGYAIVNPKASIPVSITCTFIRDEDNIPLAGIILANDLAEMHLLEKAFWENEEKLRYITSFAQDAIIMMDNRARICFWNQAASKIFGYTDDEVFGADLHKLIAPEKYHELFKTGLLKFFKTGTGEAINKTLELTAKRKSGEEFPVELSLSAILINHRWNAIGILRDISERKTAEKRLRESEEHLRTLIETSPAAVMTTDVEANITFSSRNACEMLCVSDQTDILNTSFLSWVTAEYQEAAIIKLAGTFSGDPGNKSCELEMVTTKGTQIYCDVSSASLLNASGEISGLLIVIHDITGRVLIEEALKTAKEKAEESDRLKTAFIQNISHEIRTPMNALVGFCELMSDESASPEDKQQFVSSIIESTNHLLSVITNIVEISNLKASLVKIDFQEFEPDDVITAAVSDYLVKAGEKNLKIETDRANRTGCKVMADKKLLYKSVSHIIDNAIKFTSRGTITIGCNTDRSTFRIYVKDTGPGIDEKFLDRIYEPFYQIENSVSRKYEGTGVGLTLAKSYIELMGGKLSAESTPGIGSKFTIELPLKYTTKGSSHIPGTFFTDRKLKLLVAEDNLNNEKLIRSYLRETGINIQVAHNGIEALEIYRSEKDIDLVLLDIRMPVMNGFSAAKEILKLDPDARLVAQTAYADDCENIASSGFRDYISKPYSKNQLLDVIWKNSR